LHSLIVSIKLLLWQFYCYNIHSHIIIINMNYKKIYEQFIADRRIKEAALIASALPFQSHHITPRSMGGNNSKENLINLTIEDHIRAHLLLAKAYGGKQWQAVFFTFGHANRKNRIPTKKMIRTAALAKAGYAESLKGEGNPAKRLEVRAKISAAVSGEKNGMFGKPGMSGEKSPTKRKEVKEAIGKAIKLAHAAGRYVESFKCPERRKKMSASKMGDKNPAKIPEVRAKISANRMGKRLSAIISLTTGQHFESVNAAANFLGVPYQHIGRVLNGSRKTVKGHALAYA
jgi:hypothetical protein